MPGRIIFFISIFLTSVSTKSQVLSLPNGLLYRGLDNSITVAWENASDKSIRLTSSSGKLESVGSGRYIFNADSIGWVDLTLINTKTKATAKWRYQIADVPMPVAQIGKSRDTISKMDLLNTRGIFVELPWLGYIFCGVNYETIEFTITIHRQDSVVYNERTTDKAFSIATKHAFECLQANDRIVISNIVVRGPGGKRKIIPIERIVRD